MTEQRDHRGRAAAQFERRANLPKPVYPEKLPVVQRRHEIARAIERNQVVVICGETGSGKTTQLPKICLELGRGVAGMIGHTQPRRIAARSVAARIAEELSSPLGHAVGYKVRFVDKVSPDTYVKLMTDGILLAEMQNDRLLRQYDTIIIDEAHERSLNIDFLLGCLKQLLPHRPDLKLIITSATIDPERFSRHFDDAPIVQVSGRMFPVEVRYRPLTSDDPDEDDIRQIDGIIAAVDELTGEGPGDILIFLSGEREIRETADALRKHHTLRADILPLYAKLSLHEQARVFQPHRGRRIVLATNVAETSLTVPGIHYVVDPGFARISRYNTRTKVQRLPVEEVSQASANQRKGRCGRLSDGICIRLYSEEDFLDRAEYTSPEIHRTNLASVILQMKNLRLGDIHSFPFVDPPDSHAINDGYLALKELQALDDRGELTAIGRDLARLPIDPRLGRMILAARAEGCLNEVLIIAAALSVQDPRERPMEDEQAAREAHAKFRDSQSDFMGLLKLWDFFHEHSQALSGSKLRRLCRTNFLSFIRMREWLDIHAQLEGMVKELAPFPAPASRAPHPDPRRAEELRYASIHRALLTGLLANIGQKTESYEYAGARGMKFYVFPGSGLFASKPQWLVAAELVQTTKLYARMVARIQPEWLERLAGHLVTRTYSDPHWDDETARVVAFERICLYDLPIVEKRSVHYGPIDPKTSREIFLRHALVLGEYESNAPFLRHNRQLIEDIQTIEAKGRRRDVLVDEKVRFDYYDARVPAGVYSGQTFEGWRRQAEHLKPRMLHMDRTDLMLRDAREVTLDLFPNVLTVDGVDIRLDYLHQPGHRADGVTAIIPLAALANLRDQPFEWLVPGMLLEKITALIRSLPRNLRTNFVPVAEYAREAFESLKIGEGSLLGALADFLTRQRRVAVKREDFNQQALLDHLRMNFKIVDEERRDVASGRDLDTIREKLGTRLLTRQELLNASGFNRDGITTWDFGELPGRVAFESHGMAVAGFPALVDRGESVSLCLVDTEDAARLSMRGGLRRLFALDLADQFRAAFSGIPDLRQICASYAPVGSPQELKADLAAVVADRVFLADAAIRTQQEYLRRRDEGRSRVTDAVAEAARLAGGILALYQSVLKEVRMPPRPGWEPAVADMREQLTHLVHKGFLSQTPPMWLEHLPRYLAAILARHKKLATAGLATDTQRGDVIRPYWENWKQRSDEHRKRWLYDPELDLFRWMLEEMRVSLFAQELKTSIPISPKRLDAQWMKVLS